MYVLGKDAADVFVENSQTPKSSNKTLNVVRGKKLIKKLFSIPNTNKTGETEHYYSTILHTKTLQRFNYNPIVKLRSAHLAPN